MATTERTKADSVGVNRGEFEAHQRHVDQRFQNLDDTMQRGFSVLGSQFSTLSEKLDRQTRPNYMLLVGVVTIGLTLASFAAALVYSSNSNVDALSKARDEQLHGEITNLRVGSNRWSYNQQQDYKKEQQDRDDRQNEKIETSSTSLTVLSGDLQSLKATVETWIDELKNRGVTIESNSEHVARMDERLKSIQKEMENPK